MSSSTDSHLSADVKDRFEHLIAIGEYDLATTWGREIVRKATDVTYDIRPHCIVVETKNFTGTHDYAIEEGKLVVAERGEFQYRGENISFRFNVFTLNQVVKEEIYANEVIRGEGCDLVDGNASEHGSTWFASLFDSLKSMGARIRRYVLGR